MEQKKPIVKKYEVVLGIISILIIAYMIVGKYGCFLVKKADTEVVWTDGSSHDRITAPIGVQDEDNTDTDATVREIAQLFANKTPNTNTSMKRIGLSKDEQDFYKELRSRYGYDNNANNWFTILKAATRTYKSVNSFFENGKAPKEHTLYDKIETEFGIPAAVSEEFARQGKKNISDWALFVNCKIADC